MVFLSKTESNLQNAKFHTLCDPAISDAIHYQLPGPGRSVRERQVGLYGEKIYLAPVSGMEVDKSLHPALNLQGVTFWLTKTSPSVSF